MAASFKNKIRKIYPDAISAFVSDFKKPQFVIVSGEKDYKHFIDKPKLLQKNSVGYKYATGNWLRFGKWSDTEKDAWKNAWKRYNEEIISRLAQ